MCEREIEIDREERLDGCRFRERAEIDTNEILYQVSERERKCVCGSVREREIHVVIVCGWECV